MDMEIAGPLKYKIVSFDDSEDREIHADFKEEFKNLGLAEQANEFSSHVASLQAQAAALNEDDQERQGILFILQFLTELTPHIQTGAIPLHETIVVKLQEQPPLNKLISGLQIN